MAHAEHSASPDTVYLTRFRHRRDTAPRGKQTTWTELQQVLSRHVDVKAKTDAPLWSPSRYGEQASRGNAGVLEVSTFVADIDDGTDAQTVGYWLERQAHVIVSTYSHTPEHPKLRAVVRLQEAIPSDEYPEVWRRVNQHLFHGHLDPSTRDPARMYFIPSSPPGAERLAVVHAGEPLDWRSLPTVAPPRSLARVRLSGLAADASDSHKRAHALLGKWSADLAGMPPSSGRHNTLLRLARASGGLVANGLLTESGVGQALLDACATNGLLADDGQSSVEGTLRAGLEHGSAAPWVPDDLPDSPNWHRSPRIRLLPTRASEPQPQAEVPWPAPMAEAAYHGPLGAIVRAIEPHSEADPAALFAHAITVAAGYIGTRAHGDAGDMPHPARFFCGIVGETSKGRKGTSAAPFRRVSGLGRLPVRIASGLSSGEGLIHQVRDRLEKWNPKTGENEIVDPGVDDKRLVIIEGELATLLRRMEREGNSISAMLRDAWDRGDLETLIKINPTRATGAHINIIAHITLEELRQYLHPTDVSSGFANRLLWFAAKRSRLLSRGGRAADEVLETFADALDTARVWTMRDIGGDGLIDWSPSAGALSDAGYEALSNSLPGMYGQAIQRSEAQVLRLCVLYAALDRSPRIEEVHLRAALAIWRYCAESARWIFGDRTGNPVADTILQSLRSNGELTRTQISGLFQRHASSDRIAVALALLLKHALARTELRGSGASQTEWWLPR